MRSIAEHYSSDFAPFQLRNPPQILSRFGYSGLMAALGGTDDGPGIAIGHTWKRGGCQEQRDCSQSQHQSFHGSSPLRKNSHRDTLQAT
jgi:hypothetical protein